ncbi:exosome complex protein Rrp42 [Methanobrevibacter filiformis]|uniref:Exosome complex component Rrp42 n=1 Tax=Methanobrevibacter filiformis TaxID=55758 RepID=A0A166AZQ3_9EURY|nr:exosome complex protein Rrp42 [Methanobrevibacter filiformis]KZX12679.1 ribonuclease PH [Methanobrevibacter filiformis]
MNIIPEITKNSIIGLINNEEREDGRSLNEYRDIVIETDLVSKAEGSAKVKLGDTQIIVGVKPQIGEPFPDTPDSGVLMINSEFLPMADPTFEPGPPTEDSVELARVVDRSIRESEMVDLKNLCILEGKKVWLLFVDLHIIDYDGNLFDAATLAVVAALLNTKLPMVKIENDELIVDKENTSPLKLTDKVTLCTAVKIGDKMVFDPSLEEEAILDARLSIGITESGKICAMQKGGNGSLSQDDIRIAVSTAYSLSKNLLTALN